MLKNAMRMARGAAVSSAELWADHEGLGLEIQRAKAALEACTAETAEALLTSLAEGGKEARAAARRAREDAAQHIQDLETAQSALAQKARAVEAKEKKRADAAAWSAVSSLTSRRLAACRRIDGHLKDLAALVEEIGGLEKLILDAVPKDQRPLNWPSAGWGHELGRAIALRLKLLAPSVDAMAGGHVIYVLRDHPTVAALAEAANARVFSRRAAEEARTP